VADIGLKQHFFHSFSKNTVTYLPINCFIDRETVALFPIPPFLFIYPGKVFSGVLYPLRLWVLPDIIGDVIKGGSMEWRASHILVKDRPLAEDILKKLKQGGQFESLARQFSTCPSKSSGGDLGWFGQGKMVAAFESAVKRLSPGSVGDVVQTQFGYHIIKCTGRRD
jgi:peptidyl-prolyl cis-trans isomerase C